MWIFAILTVFTYFNKFYVDGTMTPKYISSMIQLMLLLTPRTIILLFVGGITLKRYKNTYIHYRDFLIQACNCLHFDRRISKFRASW